MYDILNPNMSIFTSPKPYISHCTPNPTRVMTARMHRTVLLTPLPYIVTIEAPWHFRVAVRSRGVRLKHNAGGNRRLPAHCLLSLGLTLRVQKTQ